MRNSGVTFDDFRRLVSDVLLIDPEKVTPEAYFITDLGVDSIRMVEVLLRLEQMGLEITPGLAWRIHTVQDAYDYYREHAR
jgi:acyl carrier protein